METWRERLTMYAGVCLIPWRSCLCKARTGKLGGGGRHAAGADRVAWTARGDRHQLGGC